MADHYEHSFFCSCDSSLRRTFRCYVFVKNKIIDLGSGVSASSGFFLRGEGGGIENDLAKRFADVFCLKRLSLRFRIKFKCLN